MIIVFMIGFCAGNLNQLYWQRKWLKETMRKIKELKGEK